MMPVKQFRALHALIDQIFEEANELGYSWKRLAEKAGLCEETVLRLARYDTMYPRLQTVYLLGEAVGMHLTLTAAKRAARRAG